MKATGSLFGLAYGDAMGAPTEFLSVAEIVRRYGERGPRELVGDPALITDDTQMTLAVARAMPAKGPLEPGALEKALRKQFVEWVDSPENNRAPGMTCLRACELLASGLAWRKATGETSKGCGANMRVAPMGLMPGLGEVERRPRRSSRRR